MKKTAKTWAILIVVVLIIIIPWSVWAGFEDLLIWPAAITGPGGGTLNIIGKIPNGPDINGSNHFDFSRNDNSHKLFIHGLLGPFLAVPNEMTAIVCQYLAASRNKPGQEYSDVSVSISDVEIPKRTRGYKNTTSGGGAILITMASKDMNEFIGMGVFTDAGESTMYSPSPSGFGMVNKVLEPSTMLLLGSCLLCIGLFAMKFRK